MVRSLAQRGLPKPFAILVAALLALFFVPLAALPSQAAVPAFEIDGNLADDVGPAIDWQTLQGNPALLVRNDNGTPIGDASVFSTSSKENDVVAGENTPAQWTKGSPNTAPPKTDIGNYYKYIRTADNGHIQLFFGWDRLAPSGTDYYYLELNKLGNTTSGAPGTADYFSVPNRSAGDVRFTLHELGNGELVILAVDKWDGTRWTSQSLDVSGFDGQVNSADISPAGFDSPAIAKNGPSQGTIPADQFFETTFDLTTLIGFVTGCPPAFGTLNFRTATGESAQTTGDNLKDYLEPIALGAPSTCGSLSIVKRDGQGAALGGAVFRIHPNPLPANAPGATLGDLLIFDDADANTTVEAGTNYDDPTAAAGSIVLDQVVPGSYQVTEVAAPAGYTLEAGTKTVGVPASGNGSVTFTNIRTTGVITVMKTLVGAANGAATSFTFDVDCPGTADDQSLSINVTSGTSGSATTRQIPTGVTCRVTERSVPDWKLTAVVPSNGAVQPGQTVTFTNTRLAGTLNIVKAVSPVAGNGVVIEFGDTLTYTLTVSATGEQRQPNVVVTDFLPGRDPAHPTSGETTYVAGSAACVGTGTCTVSGPDASGKLTWALGEMAAGTTRQVTFKVKINDVAGSPGQVVAVDILNQGAVKSDRTGVIPSNVVKTPVSKVLPVKIPRELPHTGSTLPLGQLAGGAILLLGLGLGLLLLVTATRRRHGDHLG